MTYIKERILSSGNVPLSVPHFGIKFGHQHRWVRFGIFPIVRLLGDATHVGHDALIEISHYFVFKQISTLDLAANFVFLAVARVDTNDVGEAFGIGYAFQQWQLTFGKEASHNGTGIGRCLTRKGCCGKCNTA